MKGPDRNSGIAGYNVSWCRKWNGRCLSAWHSDVETPLTADKFTLIGVYGDYAQGQLAFYGVGDTMTPIYEYKAEFLEPLYPAFWLSKKENTVVLVLTGEDHPLKSPSSPSPPPIPPNPTTTPHTYHPHTHHPHHHFLPLLPQPPNTTLL